MREIENLRDLRKYTTEEEIRKIVIEYMMETIAKAEKFEEIKKKLLQEENLEEIRKLL